MSKVFISYRRDDSAGWTGRLRDDLVAMSGSTNIFYDLRDLPPGVNWDSTLSKALDRADYVLVIIGPNWINIQDAHGQRRIDNPDDYVRREVAVALKRTVSVIPVLVGGAQLPRVEILPEDIKDLTKYQSTELTERHWDNDVELIARSIGYRPKNLRGIIGSTLIAVISLAGIGYLAFRFSPVSLQSPSTISSDIPPWMKVAYSERGQAEVPGPTSNPRISDYLRSVNSDQKNDNDVDWSSAFVNWSLKQVGISGTNSIDNSSWTNWGKSIPEAKPGCIAIFSRPSVGNDSRQIGHVGFYVEDQGSRIFVIGGNQSNAVSITSLPKYQFLGCRWPSVVPG